MNFQEQKELGLYEYTGDFSISSLDIDRIKYTLYEKAPVGGVYGQPLKTEDVPVLRDGVDGAIIVNLSIYKRSKEVPTVPLSSNFNFDTNKLSGIDDWSETVPDDNGYPCYIANAQVRSTSVVVGFEWSEVTKFIDSSLYLTNAPSYRGMSLSLPESDLVELVELTTSGEVKILETINANLGDWILNIADGNMYTFKTGGIWEMENSTAHLMAGTTDLLLVCQKIKDYTNSNLFTNALLANQAFINDLVVKNVVLKDGGTFKSENYTGDVSKIGTSEGSGATSGSAINTDGNAEFMGNTHIGGNTTIEGTTNIGGDTTINGVTTIEAEMNINGETFINGDTTIKGSFGTTGDGINRKFFVTPNGDIKCTRIAVSNYYFYNTYQSITELQSILGDILSTDGLDCRIFSGALNFLMTINNSTVFWSVTPSFHRTYFPISSGFVNRFYFIYNNIPYYIDMYSLSSSGMSVHRMADGEFIGYVSSFAGLLVG